MMTRLVALPLMLMLSICAMSGCGGPSYDVRYAVSGEVTLDGKPLEEGRIVFIPLDPTAGAPGATGTITAGHYAIPAEAGPTWTKYRVQIHQDRKTGRRVPDYDAGPNDTREEVVEAIPAGYNTRSTLVADVMGEGTFDYKLESKGTGKR